MKSVMSPPGEVRLGYITAKIRNGTAEKAANSFALEVLFGESGIEGFRGLTNDSGIGVKQSKSVSRPAWLSTNFIDRDGWTIASVADSASTSLAPTPLSYTHDGSQQGAGSGSSAGLVAC